MMNKKEWFWMAVWAWLFILPAGAGELNDLFTRVEALKIQRGGYLLCSPLTPEQRAFARNNLVPVESGKIYKFRDKDLNIVVDKVSHRVLVIYEQFKQVSQDRVRNLVGELFMAYGEPMESAHDRVVYWAWGKKGQFTADQYIGAREKKETLDILATVKLHSDVRITAGALDKGDAYYVISSGPLLKFFQDMGGRSTHQGRLNKN